MEIKKFLSLFKESFLGLFKNPLLFIPGILLWFLITLLSKFSFFVNQKLSNTITLAVWLAFFWLVLLAIVSFIFSGLIGMIYISQNKKTTLKDFLKTGKQFWFKNFFIMLILALISVLIGRVAHYGAFFIGKLFSFNLPLAQTTFFLIYFACLIGILIFFSFSSFYLVLFNLKIFESIKSSFKLVKKEYLATLSLTALIFVTLFFINKMPRYLGEFLEYAIFVPLAVQLLTRFVLESRK